MYILEIFFLGKNAIKAKNVRTSIVFVGASFTIANAAEINLPGFTGTANTTVTTGLSVVLKEI